MTMYAVYHQETKEVLSIVEWDGTSPWVPEPLPSIN